LKLACLSVFQGQNATYSLYSPTSAINYTVIPFIPLYTL